MQQQRHLQRRSDRACAIFYGTDGSGRNDGKPSLKPRSAMKKAKEAVLMTYSQVLNLLLETNTTEDVIGEADIYILPFTETIKSKPLRLAEALWIKTLCVLQVFFE